MLILGIILFGMVVGAVVVLVVEALASIVAAASSAGWSSPFGWMLVQVFYGRDGWCSRRAARIGSIIGAVIVTLGWKWWQSWSSWWRCGCCAGADDDLEQASLSATRW